VNKLLKNFLLDNLSFTRENIIYFKAIMYEFDGDDLNDTDESNVGKASLGYTKYTDGVNYTDETDATDYIMSYLYQNKIYPIFNYTGRTYFGWRDNGSNTGYRVTYTTTGNTTATDDNLWDNNTEAYGKVAVNDFSYIDYDDIDINKNITVSILSSGDSYTFSPIGCNGNPVYYLKYLNKWGIWDNIYFQGKGESELITDYETYKYINVNIFNNYDTQKGLYHKFITGSRKKIILNTGWIDEVYNEKVEDLLLSEIVLLNGNDPVIITDKNIRFKTVRFDKLINYTITIEKAYDEINNIV
jgi:hypothetical protein